MKFLAVIPVVLSAISFILTMLALFAGHKQGFMEDYHIMVFNTSTLGQDFLSGAAGGSSPITTGTGTAATAAATSSSSRTGLDIPNPLTHFTHTIAAAEATPTADAALEDRGLLSSIEASATEVAGSVKSAAASILADVGGDVADRLADELGISQFYTIHIMDLCQGDYAPNATANGAWMNLTDCTQPMDFSAMDLSTILDKQLSIGPFNISLSDLGITQKIESKLSKLPTIFEALAAIYIVSAIFAALTLLSSLASVFILPSPSRKLLLADAVLAVLAMLFVLVGSLMYTIGASAVVGKIQDLGAGDAGLDVQVGTKFQALTWASFALMLVAAGYWVYELVVAFKARRRERRVQRSKVEGIEMGSPTPARAPRAGKGWWS
ncbi:unnamed protein product [Discula destructiva]